jgi:hypothetical protein
MSTRCIVDTSTILSHPAPNPKAAKGIYSSPTAALSTNQKHCMASSRIILPPDLPKPLITPAAIAGVKRGDFEPISRITRARLWVERHGTGNASRI